MKRLPQEERDNIIQEIIALGWSEDISYGEIAYLESLNDKDLIELLKEVEK